MRGTVQTVPRTFFRRSHIIGVNRYVHEQREKGAFMRQSRILPFYMAYPMPLFYQEEDTVMRDLEYLRELYPAEAKKYQKVIVDVLDRLDYEGSMIYDEYPDRWQIYRLTRIIVDRIKEQAAEETGESAKSPAGVEELVQVLLCGEIYRRRHSNRNGVLKF